MEQVCSSEAAFLLELELQSYSNPAHAKANGECCDVALLPPNCSSVCDNSFIFCWKDFGSTGTSIATRNCLHRGSTSVYDDSDYIDFPIGPLPSEALSPPTNPIILTGTVWRVSQQCNITGAETATPKWGGGRGS